MLVLLEQVSVGNYQYLVVIHCIYGLEPIPPVAATVCPPGCADFTLPLHERLRGGIQYFLKNIIKLFLCCVSAAWLQFNDVQCQGSEARERLHLEYKEGVTLIKKSRPNQGLSGYTQFF